MQPTLLLHLQQKATSSKVLSSGPLHMQGLGAPAGSIVAGPKQFIKKVLRYRKMLGGGMRQSGVLAAPGEAQFASKIHFSESTYKQLYSSNAFRSSLSFLSLQQQQNYACGKKERESCMQGIELQHLTTCRPDFSP